MAERYAASPVHAADRIAILSAESARLCAEILAGMEQRDAERRAIWVPAEQGAR
jgi:hypothetical protein